MGGSPPHTITYSHTLLKPNQSLTLNLSTNPSVILIVELNSSSITKTIAFATFTISNIATFVVNRGIEVNTATTPKVHLMILL